MPEMFNIPQIVDAPVFTATAETPVTSEPTHYELIASQLKETVNTAFDVLSSLEAPHSATRRFVRGFLGIPNEFIRTVMTSVETRPELQSVNKFDVTEGRDAMQFVDAIRSVVDRLDALSQILRFTADARKAAVAANALQVYEIAKGIARDPGSGDLQLVVAQMARDLGRIRPKPREKKEVPPAELKAA